MHTTARLLARLAIEELNAELAHLGGQPFLVADYDDVCAFHEDNWLYAARTITRLFMGRDGKVSPPPLGLSDEIQLQQCSN